MGGTYHTPVGGFGEVQNFTKSQFSLVESKKYTFLEPSKPSSSATGYSWISILNIPKSDPQNRPKITQIADILRETYS